MIKDLNVKCNGFSMVKKGQWKEITLSKIRNRTYPFTQIADEFITILAEETENEKYSNHNGKFQRSVTLCELEKRLKERGIKEEDISRIRLARTVIYLLNEYDLRYEPQKSRGSDASAVYRCITYSHEQLEEMIKFMLGILGENSVLYSKQYLFS
jgi:hypothetical protein